MRICRTQCASDALNAHLSHSTVGLPPVAHRLPLTRGVRALLCVLVQAKRQALKPTTSKPMDISLTSTKSSIQRALVHSCIPNIKSGLGRVPSPSPIALGVRARMACGGSHSGQRTAVVLHVLRATTCVRSYAAESLPWNMLHTRNEEEMCGFPCPPRPAPPARPATFLQLLHSTPAYPALAAWPRSTRVLCLRYERLLGTATARATTRGSNPKEP